MRHRHLDERVEDSCSQYPQRRVSLRWKPVHRHPVGPLVALALAMAMATPALVAGQSANADKPQVAYVHVESGTTGEIFGRSPDLGGSRGSDAGRPARRPPACRWIRHRGGTGWTPVPLHVQPAGQNAGRQHSEVCLCHDHRQDDPVEVHRRVEERQPRSVCGGRGITPAVGSGVQVGPNLPNRDRLQGLPRRSHVGAGVERRSVRTSRSISRNSPSW